MRHSRLSVMPMKRAAAATGISRARRAVRPCPRHRHPLDPVIRAIDPRHPRRDEAVVLEEVQVLPGEAREVVRLAGPLAVRTRKQRTPLCDHLKVKLVRSLLHIQPLAGKLPWRAQTKPERKYILRFHRPAPNAQTSSDPGRQ